MSFTINDGKEATEAPRSIALVSVTFSSGTMLHVSSHNGDSAHGGYSYGGVDYLPAIDDQELQALATLSEQGIDRIPSVTVKLADPGAVFYMNYEKGTDGGFKGAAIVVRLVLFDPSTGIYSIDSLIPFLGICDQPSSDEKNLTVTAQNRMNLTRYQLPTAVIQPSCLWPNPSNLAQRARALAGDPLYYPCGETRDLTTAPPCNYDRQTCTQPRRFSGSTWSPDATGSGVNYLQGKESWRNADTSGKWKEFWPLWLGGKAWITCPQLNQVADGNYTRGEVAVGIGSVNIERVIANGVELSQTTQGDFRWHFVNLGYRDGTPNGDTPYNGQGDPYGGLTVIQVLAPKSVISADSKMSVQVLGGRSLASASIAVASVEEVGGKMLVHYGRPALVTDPGDGTSVVLSGNTLAGANGVWVIRYQPFDNMFLEGCTATGTGTGGTLAYDSTVVANGPNGGVSTPLLIAEAQKWCGQDASQLDATSYTAVAAICDAPITYVDGSGNTQTQPRFSNAVALTQRRSAAEIIRGLRQSIGALIVPGPDGKLRLQIEGPLAEQQPTTGSVDGSNYLTPVSSTLRDGTPTDGYFAYRFTRSNSSGLKSIGQPIAQMPNRISFPFQDPANGYAISNFSLVESDDVARSAQEIPGGLQVNPEGIASYNHALRCAKLGLAKIHRGNSTSDTRGTDWWQWTASFRGCKVTLGSIVALDHDKYGLSLAPVRITEMKPSRNFQDITFKGHAHNDAWYLDSHADAADPGYSAKRRDRLARPAFPWLPNTVAPAAGDPLFDPTDLSFALQPAYENLADGKANVRVSVRGQLPPNLFNSLSVPAIGTQATITTTGGTIPGGATLYIAVVANDSNDNPSTPSHAICRAYIPGGTDTNQVSFPVWNWDAATHAYQVYAGRTPNKMCWQKDVTGTTSTVTLTSLKVGTRGMPDVEFDRLLLRVKRIVHSGDWAATCSGVSANSISFAGFGLTVADWIGYDLSLFAGAPGADLELRNYRVTGGSGADFTVTPDPNGIIAAGALFVMRSKPTVGKDGTGNYLEDWNWLNAISNSNLGLTDDESGLELRMIAGPGRGDSYRVKSNTTSRHYIDGEWKTKPTSDSRYVIAEAGWPVEVKAGPYDVSDPATEATVTADMNNLANQSLLVQVITLDGSDSMGFEPLAPVRDFFLAGAQGTRDITT